jgi:hypothetical protein
MILLLVLVSLRVQQLLAAQRQIATGSALPYALGYCCAANHSQLWLLADLCMPLI